MRFKIITVPVGTLYSEFPPFTATVSRVTAEQVLLDPIRCIEWSRKLPTTTWATAFGTGTSDDTRYMVVPQEYSWPVIRHNEWGEVAP